MLDADIKDRVEADKVLKGPSTQPTTEPSTQPLSDNDNFKTDWHDSLKNVRMSMLRDALEEARENYWKDISYRKLLTGGLKGVQAVVTTHGMEKAFPSLADDQKRSEFAAAIDRSIDRVNNLQQDTKSSMDRVLDDLIRANASTVKLPEEVITNEFADGAFAELDPFTNMIWPSDLEEFNKPTQGEFSGVGIQIQSDEDGSLKVVSPLEDSPAYKARHQGRRHHHQDQRQERQGHHHQPGGEEHHRRPRARGDAHHPQRRDGSEKDYTIRREIINVASVKGWHASARRRLGLLRRSRSEDRLPATDQLHQDTAPKSWTRR